MSNLGGRPWRRLRDRVLKEQPLCQIRLPGCTGISTEVDHIQPRSVAPHLTMVRSNLRGACYNCNRSRGNQLAAPTPKPARALRWYHVDGSTLPCPCAECSANPPAVPSRGTALETGQPDGGSPGFA